MKRCPMCDRELSPYDKKFCGPVCAKIGKEASDRVRVQNLKYEAIMGGGKQRHKKFEEKILKICEDCGSEHNRVKTTRCKPCADERQKKQTKEHIKKARKDNKKKRYCKECEGDIGPDKPAQARFCSDECKEKYHGKQDEELFGAINNKNKKKGIDPRFLVRGNIKTSSYSSNMGSM